jgi:hypothetical protein
LIQRTGSGETVPIWDDSWIPDSFNMKPMG